MDGEWYPATVEVGNGADAYIVRWEDGDGSDRVKTVHDLRPRLTDKVAADVRGQGWEPVGEALSSAATSSREWAGWAWTGVSTAGLDLWGRAGGPSVFTTCLEEDECGSNYRQRVVPRPPPPPPHTIVDDGDGGEDAATARLGLPSCASEGSWRPRVAPAQLSRHFEGLLEELFELLDGNKSGALEEDEALRLRSKVAVLRRGADEAICGALRAAEEWGLPAGGQPLAYPAFREYVLHVLEIVEPDQQSQEMILQQFVRSGRQHARQAKPPSVPYATGPRLSAVEEAPTPTSACGTSPSPLRSAASRCSSSDFKSPLDQMLEDGSSAGAGSDLPQSSAASPRI